MFDKIKKYYDSGIYKRVHIDKLYVKGALTEEEYKIILKEK